MLPRPRARDEKSPSYCRQACLRTAVPISFDPNGIVCLDHVYNAYIPREHCRNLRVPSHDLVGPADFVVLAGVPIAKKIDVTLDHFPALPNSLSVSLLASKMCFHDFSCFGVP